MKTDDDENKGRALPVDGEVDAVRAPVAPIRIAVGAPDPIGLGVGEHDAPGGGPCSCGAWHREAAAEPAPLPAGISTLAAMRERHVRGESTTEDDAKIARAWASIARIRDDGSSPDDEPAPREPPAPTDDPGAALAALLPVLPAAIAHYRAPAGTMGAHLASAVELLLGERERLAPILSSLLAPSDRGDTVAALRRSLAHRDWLRERETQRTTAAAEKIREQAGEIDERDEKITGLRARVAELEAECADLLTRVEEAVSCVVHDEDAARIIREAMTATPKGPSK